LSGVIALGRLVAAQPGINPEWIRWCRTLWGVLVFDEQDPGRHLTSWSRRSGAIAMLASVLVLAHSPLLESNEDAPRVASPRPQRPAACPHPA